MSQCVLKKVDPIDKDNYSKLIVANDQYQIPFFSTYRESNSYSGSEWMTAKSAEINGKTVHYINQKTLPPKPRDDVTDRYNWIFVPHLWNFYDGINPFVSAGVLDIYVLNKSNNQFIKVDLNTYNTDKSYSVHDDGNADSHVISDSVEMPDVVKDLIAKKERLYVNFKWNDKPKTFYGIYDFQNTMWKWESITDADGKEDFESSLYTFDTANISTADDNKICKAMEDFVTYIESGLQPSSNPNTIVAVPDPTTIVAVPDPNTIVAVPDPNTIVAVPNPNTIVAVPNPNTIVAVPDPTTIVAVSIPDPTTVVAVSIPDPTTVVAVPDPNTVVAVPNPDPNPVSMPHFGNANEIFIKVIFDGIVPKTVDIVQNPMGATLTDIEYYIDGLLVGSIKSDENPVYFKLEKSYAENIVKMIL